MRRIIVEDPLAHRPGHDIEIIEVIAMRRADRMVPSRYENNITVLHTDCFIDAAVIRVDTLEREAL
jgi:hypothetical protein